MTVMLLWSAPIIEIMARLKSSLTANLINTQKNKPGECNNKQDHNTDSMPCQLTVRSFCNIPSVGAQHLQMIQGTDKLRGAKINTNITQLR